MNAQRGVEVHVYYLSRAVDGGEWSVPHPATLSPERRLGTCRTGCWMGRRTGLDRCRKYRPNREWNPGPSSPWRVAIGTTLSQPTGRHLRFRYLYRQIVDVRKKIFALVCFSTYWLRPAHQKDKLSKNNRPLHSERERERLILTAVRTSNLLTMFYIHTNIRWNKCLHVLIFTFLDSRCEDGYSECNGSKSSANLICPWQMCQYKSDFLFSFTGILNYVFVRLIVNLPTYDVDYYYNFIVRYWS